ncbi:MAG: hypothetical protein D6798_00945 [Deltaproteobacteria bacterium]|nr:MAG: hypothetical protein D6798_00945 [Deltaproteobacteria bacterium]
MPAAYLNWLTDLFEEAQVPYTPETADWLDRSLRRIADAEDQPEEVVWRTLQRRWLRHGPSGKQLLAALLREHAYARRDSPLRPHEGQAYFTNDQWRQEGGLP